MMQRTIHWFRQDLRLSDNAALRTALENADRTVLLYLLDTETDDEWSPGGASKWWLHHSLTALSERIADRGGQLVLRRGKASQLLPELVADVGAERVTWSRCYEPYSIKRDRALKTELEKGNVEVKSMAGALLHEPWALKTKSKEPYKVFTPFWKAGLNSPQPEAPEQAPGKLPKTPRIDSDALEDWELLPTEPDWSGGLAENWTPGESGAQKRLADFLDEVLASYERDRDRPDRPHTSRLSPHLRWGEISPKQIWHAVKARQQSEPGLEKAGNAFLRQLAWRDFSYNLLYHWPDFPADSWRSEFKSFPWRKDRDALERWQQGMTGFPIVDAGMRELYATGYMHNRVRMIVASFLVKDLLIPWQVGAAWFWDTLVDADLANNSAGWQWVAGSGADAAPYFRIFNPITQGKKFDPDGIYVRRWVPELSKMPSESIHEPWTADDACLKKAGLALGKDYPERIVDHGKARQRALRAYEQIKKS